MNFMKRHTSIIGTLALVGFVSVFSACSAFLEQEPDQIITEEQVFEDEVMIKSVLANFYGRVTWGQHIDASYTYSILDEARKPDGRPDNMQRYNEDPRRAQSH